MQVHNENGSVTTNSNAANAVSTKAQNPGPSGSAETNKIFKRLVLLGLGRSILKKSVCKCILCNVYYVM